MRAVSRAISASAGKPLVSIDAPLTRSDPLEQRLDGDRDARWVEAQRALPQEVRFDPITGPPVMDERAALGLQNEVVGDARQPEIVLELRARIASAGRG